MAHDDVQAWLDDAFFQPGLLATLDAQGPFDDALAEAVRRHIGECPDCAAYAESLRHTSVTLDLARGPSPAARDRLLETVRSVGRQRRSAARTATPPRPRWWQWLTSPRAATALVAVALLAAIGAVAWGLSVQRSTVDDERLIAAVNVMAELVAEPETRQVQLVDGSGRNAGVAFLSNNTGRIAIFAGEQSVTERQQSCYLERNGGLTEFGRMRVSDGVSYWAGSIDEVPDMGQPGDRLVISADETKPPDLVGTF